MVHVERSDFVRAILDNLKAIVYLTTNIIFVVAIVIANKKALTTYGFAFPVALTWLHTVFTAVGMQLLCSCGLFDKKTITIKQSLPVAATYVGFVVLNNLSIQLNTVGTYQILKIGITPVLVLIEVLFYKKYPSLLVTVSVIVLVAGVTMATVSTDVGAGTAWGLGVGLGSTIISALYQIWAGVKQKEYEVNGLQLLHQCTPVAAALLAVLVPFLEPVGWPDAGPGTILGYTMTLPAFGWILGSSVLGLLVTMTTFLMIGATSSLTYNVAGHVKSVLIVGSGIILFSDPVTLKKVFGLILAMSGIVIYTQCKMMEAKK